MNISNQFSHFARYIARISGQPSIFVLACIVLLSWFFTGFFFDFSDTWQLVVNTGTTIVTFLMVFLIQNTQNRDGQAIQIKLDELIRAQKGAHNALLDLEELTEEELNLTKEKYELLAKNSRLDLEKGKKDTTVREI
jgi:low affinity Fe/Cu permease